MPRGVVFLENHGDAAINGIRVLFSTLFLADFFFVFTVTREQRNQMREGDW